MATKLQIMQAERVRSCIVFLRGQRVMLDRDIAEVSPKRLKEQVRRNRERFSKDFMFQLSRAGAKFLRSQNAPQGRAAIPMYAPYAFTEYGALMLASVLKSQIAVRASIAVVRAFVRLREVLAIHGDLAEKIASQFRVVFDAIRELMRPMPAQLPPPKKIGFIAAGRN